LDHEYQLVVAAKPNDDGLQFVVVDMCNYEDVEWLPNAYLIAAAPELYQALRNLLEMHQAHQNAPAHASARAALRKARGEAE
jgi:hypothetical protein